MSDTNAGTSGTAQTNGAGNTNSQAATGAEGAANQALTPEVVRGWIQEALNPFAAQLRRVTEGKGNTQTQTSTTSTDGSSETKTLRERLTAIEAEREQDRVYLANAAIGEAAQELGVPAGRIKALTSLIRAEHGQSVKLNPDRSVAFHDTVMDRDIPVKQFLGDFLKKSDGEMFLPPVKTANVRTGSGTAQSGPRQFFHELSPEVRAKMTPREQSAYVAEDMRRSKG
ncbi:MAG TPA: hypothetical protein VGP72_16555 [Planctomycetota bacterium]|jgi:hypothetical protein